jgi:hypothetical protein
MDTRIKMVTGPSRGVPFCHYAFENRTQHNTVFHRYSCGSRFQQSHCLDVTRIHRTKENDNLSQESHKKRTNFIGSLPVPINNGLL